jgi:2-polyprenyl-3-methyl-5-hydroxy-6-metoxy-1,4-benzoquinol methylase
MNSAIIMFNNWITLQDLGRLWEKLSRGEWRRVLKKISSGERARTRSAWERSDDPPIHAWDIPSVRERWETLACGDPDTDHVAYVCRRYLSGSAGLKAFSPACGTGVNERRWAASGLFARIDAIDLSPARIARARAAAEKEGLAGILNFQVEDMASVSGESLYDVVIAEGALHHLAPMRITLEKLRRLLKPRGLLVVNDFVGPSRFQWTGRQLEAAGAMLALIPEAYRRRWPDGRIKKRIAAPGRLRMKLADPSEAAESSRILPLLDEMFVPLEIKGKGGTIVCLVFHEIAHHYVRPDAAAGEILRLCFAVEDLLLKSGEISSDYILGIFQKNQLEEQ